MQITLEISLYPLDKSYEEIIIAFIRNLNDHPDVEVLTNRMSTYVKGEMSTVFKVLEEELGEVYAQSTMFSTVMKIIPADLPMNKGYISYTE